MGVEVRSERVCLNRCFFFQAEDGIRGAQESRGLGDVYKRQGGGEASVSSVVVMDESDGKKESEGNFVGSSTSKTVSYTHLTLPTIYPV